MNIKYIYQGYKPNPFNYKMLLTFKQVCFLKKDFIYVEIIKVHPIKLNI